MKKVLLILGLLIFSFSFVYAEFTKDGLTLTGYIKNEAALGTKVHQMQKFKDIVGISGEYKFNENIAFFASFKYWYDHVYSWYGKYDSAQYYMQHIQRNDWLRDCYLDIISGPWFLRLGKQQVAWGQADGIAILDRLNPVDLTEFWLPDAVDLRIPLWMMNINYSPKVNSNLQLLIIPDFEQSTAAPPNAPFAFRSYKLFMDFKQRWESNAWIGGFPPPFLRGDVYTNIYYPAKKFNNSKIGLQWKDRFLGWDYTLNYLYGYDYLARTYNDGNIIGPGGIIHPNYGRKFKLVQMAGGSLNHTFTQEGLLEGITLRSDAAVYLDEPTYYGDPARGSASGVVRWNNIFWLVGLDRNFFTKWTVSFQFAQYILAHETPGIAGHPEYKPLNSYTYGAQDRCENIFSLKIMTKFYNERIKPEVLWSFTDDNQGRVSPKISYEISDHLMATLGWDYFYGNEKDSNGQFRKSNQVYLFLKYSF